MFGDETKAEPSGPTIDVKTLHAKIGELTLENDFYPVRSARRDCWAERNDRPRAQAIRRARREASASAVAASTICLVRCLTAIWPLCAGLTNCISTTPCRKSDVARALERRRSETGRRHVATLMKKMGIKAIYRRPNTSKPAPGTYESWQSPGPIRWAMDLTYIPMARDLSICAPSWTGSAGRSCHGGCRSRWKQPSASRRWRRHLPVMAGRKSSIPTGSQFTSIDFTAVLKRSQIAISMDGKGAWRDNVFVERLWRSIKYEEVYLHAYKTVSEARAGIARYLNFYNTRRPHWHCCKVSDEAAFCLIQRPYISKTLLTSAFRPGITIIKC